MSVPIFDQRTADTFFTDAIALARLYAPEWGLPDDNSITPDAIAQDPGLALFKLFSLLGQDLANVTNAIPVQRQLALYRFLNMSLRPAACAWAPVSFSPAPKYAPLTLPKGTVVADTSTPRVRFETERDLQVLPATLCAALTVQPRLDRYCDLQSPWENGDAAAVFPDPNAVDEAQLFAHCLMLGDAALFAPSVAAKPMTIVLAGNRLDPAYFQRWYDGNLKPIEVTVSSSADQLRCLIEFATTPSAPVQVVAALHASISANAGRQLDVTDPFMTGCPTAPLNWLVCAPADDVRIIPALTGHLPQIDSVWCDFGTLSSLPQQAAMNGMIVDLSNGTYAFGSAVPVLDDSFSIRCDAAFSALGAPIELSIEIRPPAKIHSAQLTWQYWGGAAWCSLLPDDDPYQFVDKTNNLTTTGTISFTCPTIEQTSVAGSQGLWIRAVLSSGDYGDATAGYDSPYIRALSIQYGSGGAPSGIWTHNAFDLIPHDATPFNPYRALAEEGPAAYMAFKSPELPTYGLGQSLTLYCDVDPCDEFVGFSDAGQWQWFDATSATWQALTIEVGQAGLARSGPVSFIVPAQLQAAVLFSQTACWFRVLSPDRQGALRLRGIYPNTVGACNRTTYFNEAIGSSNGQPGQQFLLAHASVTASANEQVLLADSADPLYAIAISVIEPVNADATTLGTSEPQPQTCSYPWTRVDSLMGQGPQDRVFVVDVVAGTLVFGDGVTGKIPPPGANNVIATCYAVTSGADGNVAAGTLTSLYRATPGIWQVSNPREARGGANADRVDDLVSTGAARVRANGRAVTATDIEALAPLANAGIARAHAVEHAFGPALNDGANVVFAEPMMGSAGQDWPQLELVVLAQSCEPEPVTPMSMLDDALAYVRARSMPSLAGRMTARRPSFKPIDVAALLEINAPAARWPELRAAIVARLTRFLLPAQGAIDGRGWPIGEAFRYMAMYSFLLGVHPAVSAVTALALCGQVDDVALTPYDAPTVGSIDVRFAPAPQP